MGVESVAVPARLELERQSTEARQWSAFASSLLVAKIITPSRVPANG
jgi:hypothetical protein